MFSYSRSSRLTTLCNLFFSLFPVQGTIIFDLPTLRGLHEKFY